MDNETRSWLIGVPFDAGCSRPRLEEPALTMRALSVQQKRELASFTGLVMASTVFFLTPLLLSSDPLVPERPRAAPALLAQADGVRPAPAAAPPAMAVPVAPAAPRARTRPVEAPPLRAMPLERSRPAVAATTVRHRTTTTPDKQIAPAKGKGISGALMRVLVGNGRHRVQPFPTPASGA